MPNNISRRSLLKRGALLAGGLPFVNSILDPAQASPVARLSAPDGFMGDAYTERSIALNAPADLKARLFANENPFGPSDKAKEAIQKALSMSYRYPMMQTFEISKKIAAFEGITPDNILMAAGSSALLQAAAIRFSKPGGNIVTGDPSYDDLPGRAAFFNEKWIKVPLTADYKLDLDAMEKSIDDNTGLVYICNPNNPTATVVDAAKLKSFCERVSKKVTVFVDEAYIDYLDDPASMTMISAVKAGQNVIVARTFSKLYGFAGLRVGYVVGQKDMITQLSGYTEGSWSISGTSAEAALVSYQDKDYLGAALKKTNASKEYLYSVLKKEGYEYIPSSANFVLFPIKMDGRRFADEMMKRGVGVRYWKFSGKDWCRVSIGRMDEMEAFAAAFKELS